MSETESCRPYDERLPDETAKAWEAFCAYRDLGPGRSIDRAANSPETGPKQGQNRVKRAPSHWSEWAVRYHWVERASSYDDAIAAEAERRARAEHLQRIAEHRDRRAQTGKQVSSGARVLLGKALECLKELDPASIPVAQLPAFIRTAALVIEMGQNMEAAALGIDELLRDLEDAEAEESAEGTETGD